MRIFFTDLYLLFLSYFLKSTRIVHFLLRFSRKPSRSSAYQVRNVYRYTSVVPKHFARKKISKEMKEMSKVFSMKIDHIRCLSREKWNYKNSNIWMFSAKTFWEPLVKHESISLPFCFTIVYDVKRVIAKILKNQN